MADITKSYVDYAGLQRYDGKIKEWANSANQAAYKSVRLDGDDLKFYKKASATAADTADETITIGGASIGTKLDALAAIIAATYDTSTETYSITGLDTTAKTTLVAAINELLSDIGNISNLDIVPPGTTQPTDLVSAVNELATLLDGEITRATAAEGALNTAIGAETTRAQGVESNLQTAINTLNGDDTTAGSVAKAVKDGVDALDAQLAAVAKSGEAADVSYSNTTSGLTATDVQAAIDEVAAASAGGVDSKTVYLQDESAGQSDYAKVYKLYQGANAPNAQTDPAALIGTINIPKDLVVQSGSVVEVFYNEDDHLLHEGSVAGPDVTNYIVPQGGTPGHNYDGKYIKLIIQNQTAPLFIAVKDLVDVYTGGTTAEATVAISAANEITVTINKIAATKVIYQAADETQGTPEVTVKAKIDAIESEISQMATDVTQEISDAIGTLDTLSDVAIATHTSATGAVTFAGSVAESNGIIGAGSADTVTFTPVTNAEVDALFTTPSNS